MEMNQVGKLSTPTSAAIPTDPCLFNQRSATVTSHCINLFNKIWESDLRTEHTKQISNNYPHKQDMIRIASSQATDLTAAACPSVSSCIYICTTCVGVFLRDIHVVAVLTFIQRPDAGFTAILKMFGVWRETATDVGLSLAKRWHRWYSRVLLFASIF